METLADRVWYAYHCLPRTGRFKKPPSYRSVEMKVGLTNGTLSRIFSGERERPEPETLVALAKVLGVTLDWLLTGKGAGPTTTEVIPPRMPYLFPTVDVPLPIETLNSVSVAIQLIYDAAKA